MSNVWGWTASGRRVRLLGRTPATSAYKAGWEIGVRLDTDGQWELTWVADTEIVDLEVEALPIDLALAA